MGEWAERIYTIIDTIGNFFSEAFDAITTAGGQIRTSISALQDGVNMLPSAVVGAALVCIIIGVCYLVLGR